MFSRISFHLPVKFTLYNYSRHRVESKDACFQAEIEGEHTKYAIAEAKAGTRYRLQSVVLIAEQAARTIISSI